MVAVVVVARLWSQSWPFATFSMLIATGRKSTAQSEGPETGDPYNLCAGDWQAAQCLTMHSITELRPRHQAQRYTRKGTRAPLRPASAT